MKRRRIHDMAEARACLEAIATSGLTRTQWAHQNGIDGRSMQGWWLALEGKRSRRRPTELRLVEVVAMPAPEPSRYAIRCGPFSVDVDEHFDEGVLRRLLAVVASC